MPEKAKPKGPQILRLLNEVSKDIGAIAKAQKNTRQGYVFRGIDDILNGCHDALVKHGVVLAPDFSNHELRITELKGKFVCHVTLDLDLVFFAPDGSQHSVRTIGEALDYAGDKATNKAMSIAYKYAMTLGLHLPIEGLDDPDQDEEKGYERARTKAKANGNIIVAGKISAALKSGGFSPDFIASFTPWLVQRFSDGKCATIGDLPAATAKKLLACVTTKERLDKALDAYDEEHKEEGGDDEAAF